MWPPALATSRFLGDGCQQFRFQIEVGVADSLGQQSRFIQVDGKEPLGRAGHVTYVVNPIQ